MCDKRLPDEARLRWGRVALTATDRCTQAEGVTDLVRAPELACVQVYLLQQFGSGRGGDPEAVCRGLLALIDLEPEQAAAQGGSGADLPHHRIRHLRRIKGLIPWLVVIRPHLEDEALVAAVGAVGGGTAAVAVAPFPTGVTSAFGQ
ncbi:hypothetical protein SIN09_13680 [Streptomyces sp. F8]|uniref:Uncharacterized protein n=1 Tax=Streptomyces amritsarensis TaxID=681158 RepID=A0ABX3FY78_9ACTN|nr:MULTISPECIES: hypothetical protein [Streptomyces]MDX6760464.1 hypothetical protein [Streptomyces sp. F8]OLZ58230.1 hypothetical protein AVW11_28390 [Streptomyces amritsarensis]